jgi:hypothetical protein
MRFRPTIQSRPCCTFHDVEQTAHHEMEWFFATTEVFLRRTSIMVGWDTYPSGAGFEDFMSTPGSWQMERHGCTMG